MCIPSYTLAAGLIDQGMSPWQAIGDGAAEQPHRAGADAADRPRRREVPAFPTPCWCAAPFGTVGARLPALLRAIVACGWYGIQTWFGGLAIYSLVNILTGNALHAGHRRAGINAGNSPASCLFWALQLYFVVHGTGRSAGWNPGRRRSRSSCACSWCGGRWTAPAASAR